MRIRMLSAVVLGAFTASASPVRAQKAPAKAPTYSSCTPGSLLARSPRIFGVDTATIKKACPSFALQLYAFGDTSALFKSLPNRDALISSIAGARPKCTADCPVPPNPPNTPPVVTPPAPPVVTTPPVTPPPTPAGAYYSWNFDDGVTSGIPNNVNVWGQNLKLIDDPTGAGHGKVLAIRYASPGPHADENRYLTPQPPTSVSYGSTLFVRGQLYFPANTANWDNGSVQRKLIYLRAENIQPARVPLYVTMRLFGPHLSVEWSDSSGIARGPRSTDFPGAKLELAKWHTIELQVTLNTRDQHDGLIRVWLDGRMVQEYLALTFARPGDTRLFRFDSWWIGAQREGSDNSNGPPEFNIDETRYWDNVAFCPTRCPALR